MNYRNGVRLTILLKALVTVLIATPSFGNTIYSSSQNLKGTWLTETTGKAMLDPQTSGLKAWRGKLLSVSDGSAHKSQRLQFHVIDPSTAKVAAESFPMKLSKKVADSCFGPYMADTPDLEALVVDPDDDSVFYVATEDGRRGGSYSDSCKKRYSKTGSTEFPSLLVRLKLQSDNSLLMTDVRPMQFDNSFNIGNFPNDGIEGLTFGKNRTLYLGLEKDQKGRARIFSIQMDESFWSKSGFFIVSDVNLRLPRYSSGNHPINGMDYYAIDNHPGFIIAAARNDDNLWVIDLSKRLPTKILPLNFLSPNNSADCKNWESMDNSSVEGVAVRGNTLMLINDPWRKHYKDNIVCKTNSENFEMMAPLLFSLPIDRNWFN